MSTLQEQSDLDPHCLTRRLLKQFSRQQKQTTFVMIVIPDKMISFDRQPVLKIDRLAL